MSKNISINKPRLLWVGSLVLAGAAVSWLMPDAARAFGCDYKTVVCPDADSNRLSVTAPRSPDSNHYFKRFSVSDNCCRPNMGSISGSISAWVLFDKQTNQPVRNTFGALPSSQSQPIGTMPSRLSGGISTPPATPIKPDDKGLTGDPKPLVKPDAGSITNNTKQPSSGGTPPSSTPQPSTPPADTRAEDSWVSQSDQTWDSINKNIADSQQGGGAQQTPTTPPNNDNRHVFRGDDYDFNSGRGTQQAPPADANTLTAKKESHPPQDSRNTGNTSSDFQAGVKSGADRRAELARSGRSDQRGGRVKKADDRCSTSATISDMKWKCNDTEMWVDGAKYANIGSQALQSGIVQGVGVANANKASKDGSMSSAIDGAAKTQQIAAQSQLAVGTMNAALGVMQLMKADKHKKIEREIKREVTEANVDAYADHEKSHILDPSHYANMTIQKFGIAREGKGGEAGRNELIDNAHARLEEIGSEAQGEQTSIKKDATAGGMMSMITGAQQMILGGFNLAAAKNMKKAANNLKNAEGVQVPTFNLGGDQFAARAPQVISGHGTPDQQAAEEDDTTVAQDPYLGDPFGGPFDGGPMNPGPPADPFKSAAIPPTMGSGAGGAGAGGSTGVAGSGTEGESAARMADSGEKIQYQGAGSAPATGGRGGARGGGDGPDLSSLFAQLFPKGEEEARTDKTILDFGGQRGPASESSILGRDSKSLFTRISEVNSDKFKRGYLR